MQSIGQYFPLIFMGVLLVVMFILPEKKRQKQMKEMMDGIHVGDEIMTRGGIYGVVTLIDSDRITIATGPDNVQICMAKMSIATVTKKAEDRTTEQATEAAADEIKEDKNL